jgi:hypothetical protein
VYNEQVSGKYKLKCRNGMVDKPAPAVPATVTGTVECFDISMIVTTQTTRKAMADALTAASYGDLDEYDFTKGTPVAGATKAADYHGVAGLTGMLWKGATGDFAAFAVRPGCAAARFCKLINQKVLNGGNFDAAATATKYKENVFKKCVNTKDGMMYDFCYSES